MIDMLRGFAALLVATLHVRQMTWVGEHSFWHAHPSWLSLDALLACLSAPIMFGSIGVPIFFVISGYCIHRAHAAKLMGNPGYRVASGRFWLRRFVRIYPVMLAAMLLTLACDWIGRYWVPGYYAADNLSVASFIFNLFALEGLFSPPFGSDGVLWTLAIEIQLYAVYPLVFLLRRKIGIGWTLWCALGLTAFSWFLFERRGLSLFASYEFSWVLGAYVADREVHAQRAAFAGAKSDQSYLRLLALLGGLLIAAGCVAPYLAAQTWALGFALVLAWLLSRPLRIGPVTSVFRRLGVFSYSLYATHVPLTALAVCVLFNGRQQTSLLPALLLLTLVVACASLFYLMFERPFIALLGRRPDSSSRRGIQPGPLALQEARSAPASGPDGY